MNMALTQDAVLSFLIARSGKVRNAELLCAFAAHISCSEPEQRRRNRDLFKSFINNVAVVKRVDDVKYVVLKKKYQQTINNGKASVVVSSSSSSSFSSSPCPTHQSLSCISQFESRPITSAKLLNYNYLFGTNLNGCYKPTNQLRMESTECDAPAPKQEQSCNAQVLKVPNNTRNQKMLSVFAVVSRKSPPCLRSEEIQLDQVIPARPQKHKQEVTTTGVRTSSSPESTGRNVVRGSIGERGHKVDKPGSNSSVIRRDPQEHEWLVKSATGCWSRLYSLLLQDVHLAEKPSFLSGFTALHWAAKHGNSKMVRRILDVGEKVDVNAKSYDGYTPLHIAAIHGHESVLKVLVREYGANFNTRDNSGKKAYQYLRKELSTDVRALLGDPAASCQVTGDRHFPEWSANPSTFSKLFQSSVGRRKNSKRRLSLRFLGDDQEENRKEL